MRRKRNGQIEISAICFDYFGNVKIKNTFFSCRINTKQKIEIGQCTSTQFNNTRARRFQSLFLFAYSNLLFCATSFGIISISSYELLMI